MGGDFGDGRHQERRRQPPAGRSPMDILRQLPALVVLQRVIAQPRPFDEQRATAGVLQRHHLAVTARSWPDLWAWPALLTHAGAGDPHRWRRWATRGAAARAADAIETAARRCARGGVG
jgi:hypothetical protein